MKRGDVILIVWIASIFAFGIYIGYLIKPLVVVEVEKPVYVNHTIVKTEVQIVEIPIPTQLILRDFSSIEELEAFLASDDTDKLCYEEDFTCVQFAKTLTRNAMEQGYWMEVVFDIVAKHRYCQAYVDGKEILIEPQTDEVSFR